MDQENAFNLLLLLLLPSVFFFILAANTTHCHSLTAQLKKKKKKKVSQTRFCCFFFLFDRMHRHGCINWAVRGYKRSSSSRSSSGTWREFSTSFLLHFKVAKDLEATSSTFVLCVHYYMIWVRAVVDDVVLRHSDGEGRGGKEPHTIFSLRLLLLTDTRINKSNTFSTSS